MTNSDFEKIITTAFVNFLNEKNKTNCQFDCRPDEVMRHKKAPDFKFVDTAAGSTLLIELGRITVMELNSYKRFKDIFLPMKKALDGTIKGSFFLILDNAHISVPKKRGKDRDRYLKDVGSKINGSSQSMQVGHRIKIDDGITLSKFDDQGSKIFLQPMPAFTFISSQHEYVHGLLNEANAKFANCGPCNCKCIFVILDTSTLWYEFTQVIRELQAGIYCQKAEFPSITEIYKLELDIDWNINPIGVTQCYPSSWTANWILPSLMFDNQKEYINAFRRYFMGFNDQER